MKLMLNEHGCNELYRKSSAVLVKAPNDLSKFFSFAQNYLALSASGDAVEGMFSVVYLILNSKRISMSLYRALMLTFIHDNYGKFYPVT